MLSQRVNKWMLISEIKKLVPPPRPSSSLQGKQIHMSGFYKVNIIFFITYKEKYQDQRIPIQIIKTGQQPIKEVLVEELERYFRSIK